MGSRHSDFWSDPDVVARFRDKEPDIHLMSLLDEIDDLAALSTAGLARILDQFPHSPAARTGCAGDHLA